jgi:hypothetical protein
MRRPATISAMELWKLAYGLRDRFTTVVLPVRGRRRHGTAAPAPIAII